MDWEDALGSGETIEEVTTGSWRWGSLKRRVFSLEGKTYAVDYRVQTSEGVVTDDSPQVYEVEAQEKTITVWVRKPVTKPQEPA